MKLLLMSMSLGTGTAGQRMNFRCTVQDYNARTPVSASGGVAALRDVATTLAFIEDQPPADERATLAVQLMTLHKSKGLEFSVVILIGLDEEGILRGGRVNDDLGGLEQAKNAVYVGVTRAKNLLVASAVDTYTDDGASGRRRFRKGQAYSSAPQPSPPSMFLTALYKEFGIELAGTSITVAASGTSARETRKRKTRQRETTANKIPGYPAESVRLLLLFFA